MLPRGAPTRPRRRERPCALSRRVASAKRRTRQRLFRARDRSSGVGSSWIGRQAPRDRIQSRPQCPQERLDTPGITIGSEEAPSQTEAAISKPTSTPAAVPITSPFMIVSFRRHSIRRTRLSGSSSSASSTVRMILDSVRRITRLSCSSGLVWPQRGEESEGPFHLADLEEQLNNKRNEVRVQKEATRCVMKTSSGSGLGLCKLLTGLASPTGVDPISNLGLFRGVALAVCSI